MNEIIHFGGIDAISNSNREEGDREPDEDPRSRSGGARVIEGCHLMSAVERLRGCTETGIAYFDPDLPADERDLEELGGRVRRGEVDLGDVLTTTDRHNALVDPDSARDKRDGRADADSDADLWSVFTDNYRAMPPVDVFRPLAKEIDSRDVPNDSVFGEFRTRRAGGEVFGELLFDTMEVRHSSDDPVKLGVEFGWNYYGDRAFFCRGFAQQTRCKNSIRSLTDRHTVMHHNQNPDWREMWSDVIDALGVVGETLAQAIMDARDLVYDFGDGGDSLPMGPEGFLELAGLPEGAAEVAAEKAQDWAREAGGEDPEHISAWHLHAGVTYWLSWHWSGSEDSQAFRGHRRTANDLLFNPRPVQARVEEEYRERERRNARRRIADDPDADLTAEERLELQEEMDNHSGVASVDAAFAELEDSIEEFRTTEERLDRMESAIAEREAM